VGAGPEGRRKAATNSFLQACGAAPQQDRADHDNQHDVADHHATGPTEKYQSVFRSG
jgi:hypothetical protein